MNSLSKLLSLALGAFAIGTESYVIAGLLPDLAADLHVSVALAGQLITVFALAYAFGSPLLAVATGNMERRRLLLASLATFALFNILAATAHGYATLLFARIGLALSAGTFMPAASAYAVAVTPVERRGRALAIIYTGLTVATVVGVPLGVLVGERLGWRFTFTGVAAIASIALIGLALTLAPVRSPTSASMAQRLAIARQPEVLGILAVTVLTLTGVFSIYSYIAPFLQRTTGLTGHAVAGVLLLFGMGSAVGNLLGGAASDRIGPQRVVATVLAALIGLFTVLSAVGMVLRPTVAIWVIVPLLTVWGFVGWSFPAAQQARLVALAPAIAPITLSLNASAIYFGVSIGAALGSIMVAHGAVIHLGWVGATCEALALGTLAWSARRARQRRRERARGEEYVPLKAAA